MNTLTKRADSVDQYNVEIRTMVSECLLAIKELALKSDQQEKSTKELARKLEHQDNSTNTRLESIETAVIDQGTELKEKKLIISGVKEEKDENVSSC